MQPLYICVDEFISQPLVVDLSSLVESTTPCPATEKEHPSYLIHGEASSAPIQRSPKPPQLLVDLISLPTTATRQQHSNIR